MRAVAVVALITVCLTWPASSDVAAQSPQLTIRLYNSAHVPDGELAVAQRAMVSLLDDIGVSVQVTDCGACNAPLASSEVVVRVINGPAFTTSLDPDAFGVTYVIRAADRGWLATVFPDRIATAAARVGVDAGPLLGRVMAHEVGHLLLGVGYHGPAGVMQAEWTDAMLTRPDREWRFSAPEAARMIREIAHP